MTGDCRKVLKGLKPKTFTACVTDPPYGIRLRTGSMVDNGIAFRVDTWKAVLRSLKPGAYCLAFGYPKTWHRMVSAMERAGFEICDSILWLYGNKGYPSNRSLYKELMRGGPECRLDRTLDTNAWADWGTKLKPVWEPIVVARRPMLGSYRDNILRYGISGLAVGRCQGSRYRKSSATSWQTETRASTGKFPGNLILGHGIPEALDTHTCSSTEEQQRPQHTNKSEAHRFQRAYYDRIPRYGMTGQVQQETLPVSRYFYCPKVPVKERRDANHPTVKPIALLRYLVSLVTYPGQNNILDPFCGSGTTLLACRHLEQNWQVGSTGIDIDESHVRTANRRLTELSARLCR